MKQLNHNNAEIAISKMDTAKNKIKDYLIQNRVLEACITPEAYAESNALFAYSIFSSETPCSKNKEFAELVFKKSDLDQRKFLTNDLGENIIVDKSSTESIPWVIVSRRLPDESLKNLLLNNSFYRTAFLNDLKVVALIMFLIFLVFFISMIEELQNQQRRVGKNSKMLKALNFIFSVFRPESVKTILIANEAAVAHVDKLTKMLERTNLSLNSTILKMIQNDKIILPYTFNGTAVCFDVNGYSKIVAEYHDQSGLLTLKITEFAMELVRRYNGKYVTTAGDAAIVVFEKEYSRINEKYNLNLLGAAFARDQMREYSDIVFNFEGESRNFYLKAALAESKITFLCDDAGQRFESVAFTLTKRLESTVTQKNMNMLAILEKDVAQFRSFFDHSSPKSYEFAGMGFYDCCHVINFLDVETACDKNPELLPYFRSDIDIIFLLTKTITESNPEKLNLIFQCLSEIKTYRLTEPVIAAWLNAIKRFHSNINNDNFYKNYARLIILGKNLIPTEQWSQIMTDAVLNIPRIYDGRINASVIELLVDKNLLDTVIPISGSFLISSDTSFRANAELLIAKATLQLSEKVLADILEMLRSYNKLQVASGIYVCGQVLKYYEEKNPAGLRTYSGYHKIMRELKQIKLQKQDQLSDRMNNILSEILQSSFTV